MKKIILLILVFPFFSFSKSNEEISYVAVYNQILETGIEFPDVVFAQSVLESGHYKSKVYLANNNLFGMKFPRKRETVAIGQNMGYSVYEFWQTSIEDYMLYQQFFFKNKKITKFQYLKYLDRKYASVPGYSKKLLNIIDRFQNILYKAPVVFYDGDVTNNRIT